MKFLFLTFFKAIKPPAVSDEDWASFGIIASGVVFVLAVFGSALAIGNWKTNYNSQVFMCGYDAGQRDEEAAERHRVVDRSKDTFEDVDPDCVYYEEVAGLRKPPSEAQRGALGLDY